MSILLFMAQVCPDYNIENYCKF